LKLEHGSTWPDKFLGLLSNDVKLVGSTINILHNNTYFAALFRQKYSFREPYSHVQSSIFAMDFTCLNFLKESHFFDQGNSIKYQDVVVDHEILMSQLVMQNGWNISSILPEYQRIDYRIIDRDINSSSNFGDPYHPNGYFGRSIHPFETIYFKMNRGIFVEPPLDGHVPTPSSHAEFEDLLGSITTAWVGHKNFAIWLASTSGAETIVDLGVDFGYSTFCFAYGCPGIVYGVDAFEGDPYTGFRDTYEHVLQMSARLGLSNVQITRGDFNAVAGAWRRPIDILHIDGNHTYQAVKNDYLSWKRFLTPAGVVLFHDTCVAQFGVRRLFDEITLPKVNFGNSNGLGVVSADSRLIEEISRTFECLIEARIIPHDTSGDWYRGAV
jgi:hypothetical protein